MGPCNQYSQQKFPLENRDLQIEPRFSIKRKLLLGSNVIKLYPTYKIARDITYHATVIRGSR